MRFLRFLHRVKIIERRLSDLSMAELTNTRDELLGYVDVWHGRIHEHASRPEDAPKGLEDYGHRIESMCWAIDNVNKEIAARGQV